MKYVNFIILLVTSHYPFRRTIWKKFSDSSLTTKFAVGLFSSSFCIFQVEAGCMFTRLCSCKIFSCLRVQKELILVLNRLYHEYLICRLNDNHFQRTPCAIFSLMAHYDCLVWFIVSRRISTQPNRFFCQDTFTLFPLK